MKLVVSAEGRAVEVELQPGAPPMVDGQPTTCDVACVRPGVYSLVVDGRSFEVVLDGPNNGLPHRHVLVNGARRLLAIEDERTRAARQRDAAGRTSIRSGSHVVAAPMPGKIVAIPVTVGTAVSRGQTVVVLEAMKMESLLGTPHAGTVAEILISAGQTVQQRQPLVRIVDP
jgi:biotin carboxyl carrier protein